MKWRYSLRWRLPRTPCPGPQELVSQAGYAVCVDFRCERPVRRWNDDRKGGHP